MRTGLFVLGLLAVLVFVSFFDLNKSTNEDTHYYMNEDNVSASTIQPDTNPEIPTFSSLEYVLEETKEVDDYLVEVYREYEIYRDENEVIVKRKPTSNYNYLRYQLDED